jgi:TldD protein
MQEQLLSAIASYRNRIDYLEIRVAQSESTAISFRGAQLDAVDRSFNLAGGIRACHKGGWSFVTFNNLGELKERISEAIAQAHLVGKEQTVLALLSRYRIMSQWRWVVTLVAYRWLKSDG